MKETFLFFLILRADADAPVRVRTHQLPRGEVRGEREALGHLEALLPTFCFALFLNAEVQALEKTNDTKTL